MVLVTFSLDLRASAPSYILMFFAGSLNMPAKRNKHVHFGSVLHLFMLHLVLRLIHYHKYLAFHFHNH